MKIGAEGERPAIRFVEFKTISIMYIEGWEGIQDEVMIIAVSSAGDDFIFVSCSSSTLGYPGGQPTTDI